jgi:hypothetical protein
MGEPFVYGEESVVNSGRRLGLNIWASVLGSGLIVSPRIVVVILAPIAICTASGAEVCEAFGLPDSCRIFDHVFEVLEGHIKEGWAFSVVNSDTEASESFDLFLREWA